MYVCVFVCICAYKCMYVCMYARMYVCRYVCMYVCTHVCIYLVCIYVYMVCWSLALATAADKATSLPPPFQVSVGFSPWSLREQGGRAVYPYLLPPASGSIICMDIGLEIAAVPCFNRAQSYDSVGAGFAKRRPSFCRFSHRVFHDPLTKLEGGRGTSFRDPLTSWKGGEVVGAGGYPRVSPKQSLGR